MAVQGAKNCAGSAKTNMTWKLEIRSLLGAANNKCLINHCFPFIGVKAAPRLATSFCNIYIYRERDGSL